MFQFSILEPSANMIFYIMVSFGFVVGIILMVAPEAFRTLNDALNKDYGFKFRFSSKLEDQKIDHVDKFAIKYSMIIGMILSVVAFALLLIFK